MEISFARDIRLLMIAILYWKGHSFSMLRVQKWLLVGFWEAMHYNYKLDENLLKTLIKRNILPSDPNKRIKLIIYNNKLKISSLVINNNSIPSIRVLQKTNVIYQSKCTLEGSISENNSIYAGLTQLHY